MVGVYHWWLETLVLLEAMDHLVYQGNHVARFVQTSMIFAVEKQVCTVHGICIAKSSKCSVSMLFLSRTDLYVSCYPNPCCSLPTILWPWSWVGGEIPFCKLTTWYKHHNDRQSSFLIIITTISDRNLESCLPTSWPLSTIVISLYQPVHSPLSSIASKLYYPVSTILSHCH